MRATALVPLVLLLTGPSGPGAEFTPRSPETVRWTEAWRAANPVWRGVHLLIRHPGAARELEQAFPGLARAGVNTVIVEVNYHFDFQSHPELRAETVLSREDARRLARTGRDLGVRVIPQFSCLGHQSWAGQTFPLLTRYPELDETPGQFPGNTGIYCRSWCPQHPRIAELIPPLLDEILEGFEADALHVGLDEVFLIASEHCPRCKDGDPARLFARAVSDLHAHLAGKRKVEMLMWADRLLDSRTTGYGEWEAARNGTPPAVDLLPRDIILCDWHYEPLEKYPGKPDDYHSIPFLLGKGYRVWPAGWKDPQSTAALVASARRHRTDRLLGHLCTTWGAVRIPELTEWPPLRAGLGPWRQSTPPPAAD